MPKVDAGELDAKNTFKIKIESRFGDIVTYEEAIRFEHNHDGSKTITFRMDDEVTQVTYGMDWKVIEIN